jgi:dolichol-phosphate mannosyltransferase
MPAHLCLVLPTYEEAASLPGVLDGVRRVAPEARILIVDDASTDGTADIARRLGADVVARPAKQGLGSAYLAGFERALRSRASVVVQMDADGSHAPEDLARLLERLEAGADLALGSRYVPGGDVQDWRPARRVVSRVGCRYARATLGVPVRDLTSGFKAWRAPALEAVRFGSVRSRGYAFQVELTYRALMLGLEVTEVPIVFHERRDGQSKMTAGIAAEAAWRVPYARLTASRHDHRFARVPSATRAGTPARRQPQR